MSKDLRIEILKYIKSNGGEYEMIEIKPIILKIVKKPNRQNIRFILKDLKNEGYIDGKWSDLSFLNNLDGTMKSDQDINATANITIKGISYLNEQKLKSKQSKLATISIISIIITLFFSAYSIILKSDFTKLNEKIENLNDRIYKLENHKNKTK